MAKASKRSYFPMNIKIPTLSGGVGRQAPSKRMVTESENIDNFLVTLENSAERRRGTRFVTDYEEDTSYGGLLKDVYWTGSDGYTEAKDLWFHWYSASAAQRFLIIVDYSNTEPEGDILWIYRVASDGTFKRDSNVVLEPETRDYLTYGNATNKADEALRAVSIGSSLLILNTKVKAGYTGILNEDNEKWYDVGYDGKQHSSGAEDYIGLDIQYTTTTTVDPDSEATVWNEHAEYIAGDKAYDRLSPHAQDDTRYRIYEVRGEVGIVVGPDGTGVLSRPPSDPLTTKEINSPVTLVATGTVTSAHVAVTGMTGGNQSTSATGKIQFKVSNQNAKTTDTLAPALADWDGAGLSWEVRDVGETVPHTVTLTFADDDNPGVVTVTTSGDDIVATVGTNGVSSFTDLASALKTGINSLGSHEDDTTGVTRSYLYFKADVSSTGTGVDLTSLYHPNQWKPAVSEDDDTDLYTEYIDVKDYYYPDPDKQFLGQAIQKLSDLKFPPTNSSLTARNGAEATLKLLYPKDGPVEGEFDSPTGAGKIYYLNKPYLSLSEGYYRILSDIEQPYLKVIRTPEKMSVIDKKRMPKQLGIEIVEDSTGAETLTWHLRHVDWDMRTSGDVANNPGPSIFHDTNENPVQSEITAMSFYRDRLFLASADKVVSSRLGKWDSLWLFDPNGITTSDPIDLSVSSNSYTPISYLQPYRSFLFLGTRGDTQYELLGSENQISPLTAEISPTSFYGMADNVEPVLMNNNLFFFDKKRLYIYFGEQSDTQQQAIELSVNAPNYLPENMLSPSVSVDLSSIFIADKDVPNAIYVYTNRVSGDEILQNSFFRFLLDDDDIVRNVKALDDSLYITVERTATTGAHINDKYLALLRMPLNNLELLEPRLDNLVFSNGDGLTTPFHTVTYDPATNKTAVTTNIVSEAGNKLVVWSGENQGVEFTMTPVESGMPVMGTSTYTIDGDVISSIQGVDIYLGTTFQSKIELSPQYLRDQTSTTVNGTLNIRNCTLRYRNAGTFSVNVTRKERVVKEFVADTLDSRSVEAGYVPYKKTGLFKIPVLGFSEDLTIDITSDSIQPLGISSIEFSGKFKYKVNQLGGA